MTMQRSIQRKVLLCTVLYLIINTSKKVSPHYCPAMDTKKLKKRGNLNNCEFKKDPEKSN